MYILTTKLSQFGHCTIYQQQQEQHKIAKSNLAATKARQPNIAPVQARFMSQQTDDFFEMAQSEGRVSVPSLEQNYGPFNAAQEDA